MKKSILLLFTLSAQSLCAQSDLPERLDSHYSTDSAYFSIDTLRLILPVSEVKKRFEKALSSGKGSAWHESEVSAHGSMYSGRVEFLYEPDSLFDVRRMGYLSAYAEIKLSDNICVLKLQLWVHRPAVSSMLSRSIGPISSGSRCSKNLCSMMGVSKCSEICDVELWPALHKAKSGYVDWFRNALTNK